MTKEANAGALGPIVAIGGGDIGSFETLSIDRRIVELAGKPKPRALFIPTASGDDEGYCDIFRRVYEEELGCDADNLLLVREKLSSSEIFGKIVGSDLIYVGGGDSLAMLKLWRRLWVDEMLKSAHRHGKVLSGLSAGGNCWFNYCHSSGRIQKTGDPNAGYMRVKALGFLGGTFCPHYRGEARDKDFPYMIATYGGVGIAADDCAAVIYRNGTCTVLSSRDDARAYKLYRQKGSVVVETYQSGDTIELPPTPDQKRENADAAALKELQKIPNVGPSIAGYLLDVGIRSKDDLIGKDPGELCEALTTMWAMKTDPCLYDVFTAAIAYANGEPARPWWEFSRERKARMEEILGNR